MEDALLNSVYVSSPEFAGWLLKKGFRWRKLWKKRWVALHGAEIVYMEAEPTLENSTTLTITKAQITSASTIERDDADGDPLGFSIHINDGTTPTWHLRADTLPEKKSWVVRLLSVHTIVKWLEDFEKVRVLGVGGAGIVHELLHKSNGNRYAMKELEIKNKTQMKMAMQEAEMLKDIMENVSHPNIMHIERVFQVGSKFYLVFPLCTGGELYEHIIKRGHFTEFDAARITRDLLSGLHALHTHDILHLDIKPENLLFDTMDEDAKIKITDFGLSRVYSQQDQSQATNKFNIDNMRERMTYFLEAGECDMNRLRGTIGYMAPELILLNQYSKATDVFAAGVVLYIMLCGRPPFNSKSNREVLEKTVRGGYRITGGEWDHIAPEAKDLVRRMLTWSPLDRITTEEALQHPWLQGLDDDLETVVTDESAGVEEGVRSINLAGTGLLDQNEGSINKSGEQSMSPSSAAAKHAAAAAADESPLPSVPSGIADSTRPVSPFSSFATGKLPPRVSNNARKRSGVNLVGTLRQLSGHVKQRRSEKLANNLSHMVSSLLQQQTGRSRRSTLASQYLLPVGADNHAAGATSAQTQTHPSAQASAAAQALASGGVTPVDSASNSSSPRAAGGSGGEGSLSHSQAPRNFSYDSLGNAVDNADAELLILNSDFRAALVAALSQLEEIDDGKLTIDQFAAILTQLININTVSITSLLMGRFVDRDGDGLITADDIFALQAMLMQKSEVFLKQIAFRVYTEALWYPGRQFNLMNARQHIPQPTPSARKSINLGSGGAGGGSAANATNVPPGVIAGGGVEGSPAPPPVAGTPIKLTGSDNAVAADVVEPPKYITARHVGAVFEKLGWDKAAGEKVFVHLIDLLAQAKERMILEEQEEEEEAQAAAAAASSTAQTTSGSAAANAFSTEPSHLPEEGDVASSPNASMQSIGTSNPTQSGAGYSRESVSIFNMYGSRQSTSANTSKTRSSFTSGSAAPSLLSGSTAAASSIANLKMDVVDFARLADIDDILVQALTRKARHKMLRLMKNAEEAYIVCKANQQLNKSSDRVNPDSSREDKKEEEVSVISIATDMLSEEFKLAFQQCKTTAGGSSASSRINRPLFS